jgi:hypothetical protein
MWTSGTSVPVGGLEKGGKKEKKDAWSKEAKLEIVEMSIGSSHISHQNVILFDINVNKFHVIAYRYIMKGNLFHSVVKYQILFISN